MVLLIEAKKDRNITQFDFIGEDALSDDDYSDNEQQNEGIVNRSMMTSLYATPAWLKKENTTAATTEMTDTTTTITTIGPNIQLPEGGQLGLFLELIHFQNGGEWVINSKQPAVCT